MKRVVQLPTDTVELHREAAGTAFELRKRSDPCARVVRFKDPDVAHVRDVFQGAGVEVVVLHPNLDA